ncbi:Na/Pi cotransporter family protein [Dyadobacter sediminis]|uniref:Na/Pi cotransporter family protein n=1 Tax=Dyadobacter sediminis TaxID=1493691 RepID=A0A5R9KI94_9BACT|nr:Na/Pi symporter [Dyadobacter sediminis]TLU95829.1 Na/Pi cotransporter family protein [Dyadobacter sediminis]
MDIFLMVLGGLGLFLFAVNNLSDTLEELIGNKANKWLDLFTKNLITSVLTGTAATVLLDSSSAVIIMTIVLVNAGALTFRQSLGIVMGANIGTTFSSQLIALDIGQYSPVPIFLGLVFSFFAKSEKVSNAGRVVLYFGILFFGLYTMERAVEPLKDHEKFLSWMERLESPLRGTFIGALVTLLIQSSSATVGMVITLAKKQLINLPGAMAVMLGAELGTCSDTLMATIRADRQAVKTGLFHLAFNVLCIVIGLAVFPQFYTFIEWISAGAGMQQKIANAHMVFNTAGVLLFLPFIPLIEKLLDRILPPKPVMAEAESPLIKSEADRSHL